VFTRREFKAFARSSPHLRASSKSHFLSSVERLRWECEAREKGREERENERKSRSMRETLTSRNPRLSSLWSCSEILLGVKKLLYFYNMRDVYCGQWSSVLTRSSFFILYSLQVKKKINFPFLYFYVSKVCPPETSTRLRLSPHDARSSSIFETPPRCDARVSGSKRGTIDARISPGDRFLLKADEDPASTRRQNRSHTRRTRSSYHSSRGHVSQVCVCTCVCVCVCARAVLRLSM